MSDKQAAVIYQRVTRSANGFAIMKKQHLSSFVAGQGTLVPCIFMRFSINFQTSSCSFFVCLFFPMKLHFLVFGRHSIVHEKKSQLASNFKLTRTPTIYVEHGIMAHIP